MFAVGDDNYPRDSNNVMRQSCETIAFLGGGGDLQAMYPKGK